MIVQVIYGNFISYSELHLCSHIYLSNPLAKAQCNVRPILKKSLTGLDFTF